MPKTETQPTYDPDAIFQQNGPINPTFIDEAMRTLMRSMPLEDPNEPRAWAYRRGYSAIRALAALNPRDEIEVMLGVQALCAYHAASTSWYLGMNLQHPRGSGTRHIAAAASAVRTFDSLLKALERRQAKPLAVPVGRPESRTWSNPEVSRVAVEWETRCAQGKDDEEPARPNDEPRIVWTPEDVATVERLREEDRIAKENEGLDLANTEGILPGGGMIMPEHPTPQQEAYLGRRLKLMYQREYEDNVRRGINKFPQIRPLRTGDFVP